MDLVLFDIDGTLVDAGRAGSRAFGRALERELSWPAERIQGIRFAGNTDLNVLQELRDAHGDWPEDFSPSRFFETMAGMLSEELSTSPARALPGALELVTALHGHQDVILGLLTGNAEICARIKLDLAGFLDVFGFGGFGCRHPDRRILAEQALTDARRLSPAPITRTWLVGDTPNDMLAARHLGAVAVGVTTGPYDETALRGAGADWVLSSLAHWDKDAFFPG